MTPIQIVYHILTEQHISPGDYPTNDTNWTITLKNDDGSRMLLNAIDNIIHIDIWDKNQQIALDIADPKFEQKLISTIASWVLNDR